MWSSECRSRILRAGFLNTDYRRAMGEFRKAVLTAPAQPFDLTQRLAAVDAALAPYPGVFAGIPTENQAAPEPALRVAHHTWRTGYYLSIETDMLAPSDVGPALRDD